MVFCNKNESDAETALKERHNPYFNRWFSAIAKRKEVPEYEVPSQSLF